MKREPALDGMRAFAVLGVVLFHAFESHFGGGWAGVDVFFVLSGYLITSLLLQEVDATGKINFRRFYVRRALRLTPALACLLIFELVRAVFSNHPVRILLAVAMAATYLMNWSRAFGWFPQDVLGHTWSLSIEEQFYILWPTLMLLIRQRRPLIWVGAAIVIVILWRCFLVSIGAPEARTYNGFDTHSDGLLLGCFIAFLPAAVVRSKRWGASVSIPILIVMWMLFFTRPHTSFIQSCGLTIVSVCGGWMCLAVISGGVGWFKRILSVPPLVYVGQISYGIYLWHAPLNALVKDHIATLGRSVHNEWMIVLLTIVGSFIMAMLSFHFVEKPFLRLKARFEPVRTREGVSSPGFVAVSNLEVAN